MRKRKIMNSIILSILIKKILFIFLTNILKAPFNISLTYISNFIGKHESGKSIKHPHG